MVKKEINLFKIPHLLSCKLVNTMKKTMINTQSFFNSQEQKSNKDVQKIEIRNRSPKVKQIIYILQTNS